MKRKSGNSLHSLLRSVRGKTRDFPTLKNVLWYSSSNLIGQLLGILTAFVRPKLLGPELFGLFSLLRVIPTYAQYLDLGARSSMRYLIAYHRGRGEDSEVRSVTGTVFWGSLFFNSIAAIAVALLALIPGLSVAERFGLGASAVLVVVGWAFHHYYNRLKGEQNFRLVSLINFADSLATVSLSLVLIYLFGIYGAFLSLIAAGLISLVFMQRKGVVVKESGFEMPRFVSLIQKGFPIMTFNLAPTVLRTGDRFVISLLLGAEQLGYYGISAMVLGFLLNIPGASREVIELQLMEQLQKSEIEDQFRRFFWNPILKLAFLMPLLIIPSYLLLPYAVQLLLPRYLPGVVPTQMLIFASYFIALSYPIRGTIVANNWQLKASLATVPSILVNLLLSYLFIQLGWGIVGAALGTSVSFITMFASLMAFVLVSMRKEVRSLELHHLLAALFPWILSAAYVFLLEYWEVLIPLQGLMSALVQLTLFGLLYCAVLLLAFRFGWLTLD